MAPTHSLPQYRQVADTLRRRIQNGVYRSGEVLPSLAELEQIFSVSSITVRKALGILAEEGRVSGRRGFGTLVMPGRQEERVAIQVSGNFREWLESASGQDRPMDQDVLGIAVKPGPPGVAKLLGAPEDGPLWCMRRVRRIKGTPVSYHVNYGLPAIFGAVTANMMAPCRSFVEVMRNDLGIPLGRMEQWVQPIVADRDLAALLEIGFGDPLFFMENVYTSPEGEVIDVTHLYLRGDRYVYRASIPLEDSGRE